MKRNTTFSLVALILVVIGGVGMYAAYKGYKKYKAKQNQEFRVEGKMLLGQEGVDPELVEKSLLTELVLDELVAEHDLVGVWGLSDAEAAKNKIQEKFSVKIEGVEASVRFQDRDKDLARKLLEAIVTRRGRAAPKPQKSSSPSE